MALEEGPVDGAAVDRDIPLELDVVRCVDMGLEPDGVLPMVPPGSVSGA